MKTNIAVLMVMTGILAILAPLPTIAQRANIMGRNNFVSEIPGLTQQQKEKILEIRLTHAKEVQNLNNRISEKNATLRTVTQQENPSIQNADQILEEIYELRLELAKSRMRSHLKIRAELDDEQKLYFDMYRHNRLGLSYDQPMGFRNRPYWPACPRNQFPGRRGWGWERPGSESK